MPQIPLTQGAVALVDDEDFERLSAFSWHLNGCGYAVRRVGRRAVLMHREILRVPPSHSVDHANLDPLDNRRANLRAATPSQQLQNRRGWSRTDVERTSRFKGVSWDSSKGLWRARIRVGGIQRKLGWFRIEEDAARAYDAAAVEAFGAFARPNFPAEVEAE